MNLNFSFAFFAFNSSMRHHNVNRKFGRVRKVRRALLSSLAASLIIKNAITTTLSKAKELRPFVEKLVSKSREMDIAAKKLLARRLHSQAALARLFASLAPKYKDRKGGYTRITKIGNRRGDGATVARIEFV